MERWTGRVLRSSARAGQTGYHGRLIRKLRRKVTPACRLRPTPGCGSGTTHAQVHRVVDRLVVVPRQADHHVSEAWHPYIQCSLTTSKTQHPSPLVST